MKKSVQALFLAAVGLSLAGNVYAADLVSPSNEDGNITVGSAETHRNLYVAGSNVTVNGRTQGDLATAGIMVNVEGDVEQDILIAGGTLNINSTVGGDVRMAGGNVSVNGSIGGDVVVVGGNVTFSSRSLVGGDILVAGGSVVINGPVVGSIRVVGGNVTINSRVAGSVSVRASQSLSFGSSAEVIGAVDYTGPTNATVENGAKVGTINFTERQNRDSKNVFKAIFALAFLIKLAALIIAALVLSYLKKSWVHKIWTHVHEKPLPNMGWGLVFLIVPPIVVLVLLVTIVGYYVSFIAGAIYILALLLTNILSAVVSGYYIMKYLTKPTDQVPVWQPVVIGAVAWSLLGLIPVIGWVVMTAVYLQTLGALVMVARNAVRE